MKLARVPARRAISRTTSLKHDGAIGAGETFRRRDRDLELVWGVLGEEPLRLDAGVHQGAHHLRGKRIDEPLRVERERQRRRVVSLQLELVLEARLQARVERALELGKRVAQEAVAGSTPTAARLSRRCRTASARACCARRLARRARACRRRGAGAGRRSSRTGWARRPGRAASARGWRAPSRRRHGDARSSSVDSTARPRTIAPRSQHTSATSSVAFTSLSRS